MVEYKKLGRGNRTVDHRIGESDPTMSFDEKMAKRFALERQVPIHDIIAIYYCFFNFSIKISSESFGLFANIFSF